MSARRCTAYKELDAGGAGAGVAEAPAQYCVGVGVSVGAGVARGGVEVVGAAAEAPAAWFKACDTSEGVASLNGWPNTSHACSC